MADLLLSALIPVVLRKAADSLCQRIGEMWGINGQRERLHNMLLEIQAVLPDAEEQGNSNAAVKSWLEKLKSAAYDADDLLDMFCYEELRRDAVRRGHKVSNVSAFFSLESPTLLHYKMSGMLKKVVGRVDGLLVQMGRFGFVHGRSRQVAAHIITNSVVVESKVLGRDEDKENVMRLLLEGCQSDNLRVVPIVGMGGLGKTTLAKLVYNDPRVEKYFNLFLWVCVSQEFKIGHLVKSIIELVKGECNLPIDNMELLQRRLRQVLSGNRYVLVLDDVWNEKEDKWEELRVMLNCGDSGSVVIVTTRSSIVATIMGTVENYDLRCLGDEDSWSLFHARAFSKGVTECQELVQIGRMMVQNCRGLPLAINTLGSLMSYKFEVREWLAVLKESRIWEQRPVKDEVLPILRLSYEHLPSYMKQCFAFCAVYPKDYEMDKDKLIQLWMANGFIPSDESSSLEMEGNNIFNELAWRSLLQEVRQVCPVPLSNYVYDYAYRWSEGHYSETKCKMHDLIHDLAQSIMGDECLSTSEVQEKLNQPIINVHHISVRTHPLDINRAIDCFPSIRSLISSSSHNGSHCVKNIGFQKSNSLRILELNNLVHIEQTIITPRMMKHLRYLELSSVGITSLPEAISTLYLLQTLKLSKCCNLEKLPEGMRYMSNLRHLYISKFFCKLRSMPEGLGQLNCLQMLTTYIVGTDAGNSIRELRKLNNLHGELNLYNLRKIKHVVDAWEANLIAKQNLDDLVLCWGMPMNRRSDHHIPESVAPEVMHCDTFKVMDALKPFHKLKSLEVTLYRGDKFPLWMTEYQMLENLIELYIIECRECMEIPPIQKLPFLRILQIKYLDNLRHLCKSASTSVEGGEHVRVAFPSLFSMVLYDMPKLCSWCEGEVGNNTSLIFPELKRLVVANCPKLIAMPIVPSLVSVSVNGNKNLSCFATGLTSLHDLSLMGHDGSESLSFQPWESLHNLYLRKYNSIVPVCAKEEKATITPTKCRFMHIYNVSNIPSNTSLWFWKFFTFLERLRIEQCDSLIYWPEEEFKSLNCLREIIVYECPNFVGSQLESPVGRSITEVLLPMLQSLAIMSCPNLVEIPKCSIAIRELWIRDSSELQCLPEWLGSMSALKELRIALCESLNSLPHSIGGLTNLEVLKIEECPQIKVLPDGMEGLTSLEELWIEKCPKIRDLPQGLLQQLKNLNKLWIEGCPHLERHFQKYGKYQNLISEIQLTKFGKNIHRFLLK